MLCEPGGGRAMSDGMGITLAIVTLASIICAYWAGQDNIIRRLNEINKLERERKDRWREWDTENLEDFDE
jgi:hypothetical protein